MGETIEIYGTKITLPDPPEQEKIFGWDRPQSEQLWAKRPLPTIFNNVTRDGGGNIILTDEQEEYCKTELDYIKKGYWFYKNGEPCYITGRHYYYLQYWKLENKKSPEYRDTSRNYFLYLDHWRNVYWCLGILRGKGRRTGATSESTSNGIYEATTVKNSVCGVLSKTNTDARKLFLYRLQFGFRHLPFFLQPTLANDKDSKTELVFSVPLDKKNKKASLIDEVEGLNSRIDYQSTALNSYDQERLTWLLGDEGGKWPTDVPFSQFLSIVAETFVEGADKTGFGEFPSTVNEMTKKGGAEFKKAWDGATWVKPDDLEEDEDDDEENEYEDTEETANRFVRYFCPAYDGLPGFIGKFGESIIDAPTEEQKEYLISKYGEKKFHGQLKYGARAYLLKRRRKLKGEKLEEEIRKYPFNEVEMFMAANEGCVFNSLKITDQRQYLADNSPTIRKIYFYRDDSTQLSKWRDAHKGDEMYWEVLKIPKQDQANKFTLDLGAKRPARKSVGVIGVDGYSNEQGGRKYGSKACGMMYFKFDFADPNNTGLFGGWIYGRPSRKEILYDQLLLAAEYYGFQIYFEHTADDYVAWFRQRGKLGYLGRYPMNTIDPKKKQKESFDLFYGFPINPFAMTKQTDAMISYVEDFCDRIYWDKLLEQMLIFDPNDRTKSDCVVAAMIALVCSLNVAASPPPKRHPLIDIYPTSTSTN